MKEDLIKQLQKSRKRLLKAIKLYPDHPKGQWSRKELLSHIAGWDEEDIKEIEEVLTGRSFTFNESLDDYNRKSVYNRSDKTEAVILQEMNILHRKIIEIVKKLGEQQLTGYTGGMVRGKPVNLVWVIKETIDHDNEHAKEIEEKYI